MFLPASRRPAIPFRSKVIALGVLAVIVFALVAGGIALRSWASAVAGAEGAREGEIVLAARRAIEIWKTRTAEAVQREAGLQTELSWVRQIEPRTDLPLAEVIDREGKVEASFHRPEALRTAVPSKRQMPQDEGLFLRDMVRGREVVTVQAKTALPGSAAFLVGGYVVGDELLGEFGRAGLEAWVFLPGRGSPVRGTRDPDLQPVSFEGDLPGRALELGQATASARVRGIPTPLRAVAIRLPSVGNQSAGVLVVAFSEAPFARLRSTLVSGSLVALLGGFAAAGLLLLPLVFWMTRPFRRLQDFAEQVQRGDLDARLPEMPRDELGLVGDLLRETVVRLRAEIRERARAERFAAWRDFARKVAHEIKNPLAPIRTSVENLRRARAKGPESLDAVFTEATGLVLQEVATLQRLAESFSALGKMEDPQFVPASLSDIAEASVALFRESAAGVAISTEWDRLLPDVFADPRQIGIVVKNLLKNALEALATRPAGESPPWVRVRTLRGRDGTDPGWAEVSVEDNGPGIPEEVRGRLFEPYVTTKADGTGLGLALSAEIARRHGGRLTAESTSAGARFVLALPVGGRR